jgi:hypothetical protein
MFDYLESSACTFPRDPVWGMEFYAEVREIFQGVPSA